MKVAFFSNFLNHHQLPFCLAMCQQTDNNFTFIATERIPQERLNMGYADMNEDYPFVLRAYESSEAEHKAEKIAVSSDVVITGSAPEKYTKIRIEQNKFTFRYSERIYKDGLWRALSPKGHRVMYENHTKYKEEPLYMLCASAYTAMDFAIQGAYIDKTYKWGYFPEVKQYDIAELMGKKLSVTSAGLKHPQISILWAGRFIGWKHPDASIQLAAFLKEKGYSFRMSIIGNGEMKAQLENMIADKNLSDCVELLGAMPPEKVREHMERADIFLFTSDFHEGWGAVMNESMNSGCAVVASHAVGSVPFLIQDGVNGAVYKNGSPKDLNRVVMELFDNPEKRRKMGCAAYQTMTEQWNGEIAAKRFIALCEALKDGKDTPYKDGPCSRAERLFQWDMYKYCKKRKNEQF